MDIKKAEFYLDRFTSMKILIIGDLMIDCYLTGKVDRISPEAPVPVLDVTAEEYRLGGASNVVNNIHAMGAEPRVIGLVGDDRYAAEMTRIFAGKGIDTDDLIIAKGRPTTLKTRVVAHSQQMMRIDRENARDIDCELEQRVIDRAARVIPEVDAVVIEDYNKGLLTPRVIREVLALCNQHRRIVSVDPKFRNFFEYKGCTVFKPNFNELQKNIGAPIETEQQFQEAAATLMDRLDPRYLVITRGERGLTVFSRNREPISIPTYAREVFDVSGAGDTVISALTLALSVEENIREAAELANHAAGKVCGKLGIHPAHPTEIIKSFTEYNHHSQG
jgi:D-glycero-beta-D-manno-heptose-7-phosphate kinase